jgi:hypothetical protein
VKKKTWHEDAELAKQVSALFARYQRFRVWPPARNCRNDDRSQILSYGYDVGPEPDLSWPEEKVY